MTVDYSDDDLDEMQQAFLIEFVALMDASHYRILDQATWDIAKAESFSVSPPLFSPILPHFYTSVIALI